jgi:hypothetical protein
MQCTNLLWSDLVQILVCRAYRAMDRYGTALIVCLLCLTFRSWAHAQYSVPDIQPTPLIRLTGVLEAVQEPRVSALPVLSVWLANKPWLFRVAQVESVIPAYRAQEQLREVSSLGLRFIAGGDLLALLLTPEMHDRPIVIEGWLRVRAGVLRIRTVRAVEEPQGP